MVALISGGLDSAVMVGLALRKGREVWPLFVRQGALWESAELASLKRFLETMGRAYPTLQPLATLSVDLPARYLSAWAQDPRAAPPDEDSADQAVYLPGRNMALLFQAAMFAQSRGVRTIWIGLLAGNPFADARPRFLHAFEAAFEAATGYSVHTEVPLGDRKKTEVLAMGRELPLEDTFSCLRPRRGLHCGRCNKCAERARSFARAAIPDPTRYATEPLQDGPGQRG